MKQKSILPFLVIGIATLLALYLTTIKILGAKSYPPPSPDTYTLNETQAINARPISISEIKQEPPSLEKYKIEGYVVKLSKCPSCPQGATCELCVGNYIVISDENDLNVASTFSNNQIAILASNIEEFKVGNKHTFVVRISYSASIGGAPALELVE